VTYNPATTTATLTPSAALVQNTAYSVTVRGGTTDPRVKDVAANPLAANFTSSFTTGALNCPCSVFPASAVPIGITINDPAAIELGMKFQASVPGTITAIRFYKGATNTGTHVGTLWTSTGTQLGTVTFANETVSGWQQATLPIPVAIQANTTYVVSYHTTVGRYSANNSYFGSAIVNGPLTALASGASSGNGVYLYGSGGFPTQTYNASNYWVDVVFGATGGTTPPTTYGLTVTKTGTGTGTVTTSPAGIDCGSACSASYASGTSVTLIATPATGSTFTGWGGACTGTGPCTFTMSQARDVTAMFTATTPAGTDLVAAYSFNEGSGTTVADASGKGHTGTITGARWTSAGKYGSALNFDGRNDVVTINDSSLLDLTNGLTVSAWVYPTTSSGTRTVVLKERSGGMAYGLYANDSTSRPAGQVNTGGNDAGAVGANALPLNTWSHLATSYDGTALTLFVNGVQVGSRALSGAIVTSTGMLRIGGNGVWGQYFKGRIDEVRIYGRPLTGAEIQQDMLTPVR
jgi:hypothetical protein